MSNRDVQLYVDIPLTEKLESGFGDFYKNVLEQREGAKEAASQLDEEGNRPPEVRLGRISGNGGVKLEFTNSMQLPDKEEFIELNDSTNSHLVDIRMLKGDSNEQNENLEGWQIVSVSSELIEIDLNFVKPLEVSQGEAKDRLIVQVSLHQFPDDNDNRLPISVNRIKEIPLQFSSKSEAEAVADM